MKTQETIENEVDINIGEVDSKIEKIVTNNQD